MGAVMRRPGTTIQDRAVHFLIFFFFADISLLITSLLLRGADEEDIDWDEDDGVVLKTLAPSFYAPCPIPSPHPHLLAPPPFDPITIHPGWPVKARPPRTVPGVRGVRADGTPPKCTAAGVRRS